MTKNNSFDYAVFAPELVAQVLEDHLQREQLQLVVDRALSLGRQIAIVADTYDFGHFGGWVVGVADSIFVADDEPTARFVVDSGETVIDGLVQVLLGKQNKQAEFWGNIFLRKEAINLALEKGFNVFFQSLNHETPKADVLFMERGAGLHTESMLQRELEAKTRRQIWREVDGEWKQLV